MIKWIPKYSLLFIVCILLQVFIFNEMQLGRYFNPSFYLLFLLLLPFESPKWLLLITGFVLGIIIDAYANTPGINAAATVFAAFIRPEILNLFSPRDGFEPGTFPRISYYGFTWFLKYTLVIVVIQQSSLQTTDA
ncbi:MAG: rod shape-determining protein MreD [Bacteroidales bacterium]